MDQTFNMDQLADLPLDLDLADAEVDLTSWLFQDVANQDFCNGAKEMHSLPSEGRGSASPPFIVSQDLNDWMEISEEFKWDQPLGTDQYFSDDLKQQSLFDSMIGPSCQTALTTSLFDDLEYQKTESALPEVLHQCDDSIQEVQQENNLIVPGTVSHSCEVITDEGLYSHDQMQEVLYPQEQIYSPYLSPGAQSPDFLFSEQESFDCMEEVERMRESKPSVISVPISDAFQQIQHRQETGTSNIQFSDNLVHSLKLEASMPSSPNQQQPPKKIVINLKRISRPVKAVPKIIDPVAEQTGPTLKEIVSSVWADDLIRQFVSPIKEPMNTDTVDSVNLGDRRSSLDDSTSTILLSPMNGDMEIMPESPESIYVNEFVDESETQNPKRTRPYSLPQRKLRKKEQNKRAALRYRQKKKSEEDTVFDSLQREEQKHKFLKEKYDELFIEVNLMKKLMKEVIDAKARRK